MAGAAFLRWRGRWRCRRRLILLYLLQTMSLLRLPADLMMEMAMPRPQGVAELAQGIEVVAQGGMAVSQFEIHEPDVE